MLPAREPLEHPVRIRGVRRLPEHDAVELDGRIGGEDPSLAHAPGDDLRLLAREAANHVDGRLSRARRLVDIRRVDVVRDPEPGEQLTASRRRGRQDEPARTDVPHAAQSPGAPRPCQVGCRARGCVVAGPGGMRGRVGWLGVVVAAACVAGHRERAGVAPSEPLTAGLRRLAAGEPAQATRLLADAAARYPALDDYVVWFRTRAAVAEGRPADAAALAEALVRTHPDSVWVGAANLVRGLVLVRTGALADARAALVAARDALPRGTKRAVRATLALAEVDVRLGNADEAIELARELRRSAGRTIAGRRARRLTERVRRERPDLIDPVEEAETRLKEGDAAGAREAAETALQPALPDDVRARLLWTQAHAEHALGLRPAAEASCLALARDLPGDALAPRALATVATWRWNADDDGGAVRLFGEVVERFPASPQAPEALYAIGRIGQEAGRWADARAAYARLVERFPHADLAPEARWRGAWVRWLAGETSAAAEAFAAVAARTRDTAQAGAEYWRARALERLGRDAEARARLEHVADHHWATYYATLADRRLGRRPDFGAVPASAPAPPFPADLPGAHAERARILAALDLRRFARVELDAAAADVPPRVLLDAYRSVGAVGPALRLAHAMRPHATPGALAEYLYPLGYWDAVRPAAEARGVDPLLVVALIRQESLFEPEAVSPAGAYGLMQLMPATARRMRAADGMPPPSTAALRDVATNVDLGVALLARLLARYGGSAVKALAAYNGGEDAVAKWERRYAGRDEEEFVEMISFRETRDYVKAVLRNYRLYRLVYTSSFGASGAAAASPATTSDGSPPNAPFDMIAMTSPARAVDTR
jgi:soluble lytic murein transglycosylase